ncbi:hypothetical protein SDC9_204011 [bioreactor metagenome]|uniref:Uncharacterized protein n=1 Tax=bioreactor metagenome TaxID=1076179 RepID=A0A645J9Y1_9ZZZZ
MILPFKHKIKSIVAIVFKAIREYHTICKCDLSTIFATESVVMQYYFIIHKYLDDILLTERDKYEQKLHPARLSALTDALRDAECYRHDQKNF